MAGAGLSMEEETIWSSLAASVLKTGRRAQRAPGPVFRDFLCKSQKAVAPCDARLWDELGIDFGDNRLEMVVAFGVGSLTLAFGIIKR